MEARVAIFPGKWAKGEIGHLGMEGQREWVVREGKAVPFPPQRLQELQVCKSVAQ